MARPRIFDYDEASEEAIITEGVEGAQLTWIGINPVTQPNGTEPFMHLVFFEGVLNATGDAVETKTRGPSQINFEGSDFTDFYIENKTLLDDLVRVCLLKAAEVKGKTGAVVET